MDQPESKTHSLLSRSGSSETEAGRTSCCGHIRHVSNGEPHYLKAWLRSKRLVSPLI